MIVKDKFAAIYPLYGQTSISCIHDTCEIPSISMLAHIVILALVYINIYYNILYEVREGYGKCYACVYEGLMCA